MSMAAGNGKYSCRTSTETLEWIHAIIDFIKPYTFFTEAHVVNFFKVKTVNVLHSPPPPPPLFISTDIIYNIHSFIYNNYNK